MTVVRAGFGALYEVATTLHAGDRITVSYAHAAGVVSVQAWAQLVTNLDFSGGLSATPWDDNPFVDDASQAFGAISAGGFATVPEAGAMQNAGFRGFGIMVDNDGFIAWPPPLGGPSVSDGDIFDAGDQYAWKFGSQPNATTSLSAHLVGGGCGAAQGAVVAVATVGTVVAGTRLGTASAAGDTVEIALTADVPAFPGRCIVVPNVFVYDPAVLTPTDASDWPHLSDDVPGSTNRGKGRLLSPVELPASAAALTFRNYLALG